MSLPSKHVDIFEVPNSDLERTKPQIANGRGRSMTGQQTSMRTKTKSHCNARSQNIGEQTQSEQKVRSGWEQMQSVLENGKSKGGKHNKPRRSARLEAQRSKDVMNT